MIGLAPSRRRCFVFPLRRRHKRERHRMTWPATYAIPPSFLGIERRDRVAPICIAGIPLDIGTTNRSGARFGPAAIRQASRMLVDGDHPRHWVDPTTLPVADVGDIALALGDIAGSLALIEQQARG